MKIINAKIAFVSYLFLFVSSYISAQTCDWCVELLAERELDVKKIEVDQKGNIYLLSYYAGKVKLDQKSNITNPNSGYFIASYDSDGNLRWSNEGSSKEPMLDFCIDAGGNLLLLTMTDNDIQTSAYVYQIDDQGQIVNNAEIGTVKKYKYLKSSKVLIPNGIDIDDNGCIYIAGGFQGDATFLNKKLNSKNKITSFGDVMPSMDVFLTKYSSDLKKLLWMKTAGGNDNDYAKFISVSRNGNVFVGGEFTKEITFEDNNLESVWLGDEYSDVFIAGYNTNGEFLWVNKAGGDSENQILNLISDDQSNVYVTVTGQSGRNIFEIGSHKYSECGNGYFIAKFKSNGLIAWSTASSPIENLKIYNNKIYLLTNGTILRYDPEAEVKFFNNLELKVNQIKWLQSHGESKGYFDDFTIGPNEEVFLIGNSDIDIQECNINISKKANANLFLLKLMPPYNEGSSQATKAKR